MTRPCVSQFHLRAGDRISHCAFAALSSGTFYLYATCYGGTTTKLGRTAYQKTGSWLSTGNVTYAVIYSGATMAGIQTNRMAAVGGTYSTTYYHAKDTTNSAFPSFEFLTFVLLNSSLECALVGVNFYSGTITVTVSGGRSV